VTEDNLNPNDSDAWAKTLKRIEDERAKAAAEEMAAGGRGVKRKAAIVQPHQVRVPYITRPAPLTECSCKQPVYFGSSPVSSVGEDQRKKSKFKSKSVVSTDDDDVYQSSVRDGTEDDDSDATAGQVVDGDIAGITSSPAADAKAAAAAARAKVLQREKGLIGSTENPGASSKQRQRKRHNAPLSPIENRTGIENCGLCHARHGPGACYMTESSENLAEYRYMLLCYADDEPLEERVSQQPLLRGRLF
jgi:hypothetical protein